MKIKEFLQDYLNFIGLYFFVMTIISTIVYFDNEVKISSGSILYLNILMFFILICFLCIEFFKKKKQLKLISESLYHNIEDIARILDEPLSNEQKLYCRFLHKLNGEYLKKLNELTEEKREHFDFINYWVHEIKTPIAATRLFLENEAVTKEEVVDVIEDKIMSIENYVEQALYYARLDDFAKDYLISDIQVEQLIKNIVKKNAKMFISKRIKIILEDLDMTIQSDVKWINFIIEQVLLNAIKYTNNNGEIKIYGHINTKEKYIVIEDNGIGIKEEDIKRVFDKGFTGYNGRSNAKATGLGLYLSKKLANKLGNDISIESEHLKYTRVFIHFPNMIGYYDVF